MCNTPDILYKYRIISDDDRNDGKLSYTRNLLTLGELYFSKFSELKDPNEAIFDYSDPIHISVSDSELTNFPEHTLVETATDGMHHIMVNGRDGAKHVRSRIEPRHGILCLTKNSSSSLMFDYYANGHTGICVGLEWKALKLVSRNTQVQQLPKKLVYRNTPPLIDPYNPLNFDEVFYTKWKEYKHEQEYRLTYKPGLYDNSTYVKSAIKEIIFGCAMYQEDKNLVQEWVKESGITVKYFGAHLKPKSYDIALKPL